jgi:hypothetical protein
MVGLINAPVQGVRFLRPSDEEDQLANHTSQQAMQQLAREQTIQMTQPAQGSLFASYTTV